MDNAIISRFSLYVKLMYEKPSKFCEKYDIQLGTYLAIIKERQRITVEILNALADDGVSLDWIFGRTNVMYSDTDAGKAMKEQFDALYNGMFVVNAGENATVTVRSVAEKNIGYSEQNVSESSPKKAPSNNKTKRNTQ